MSMTKWYPNRSKLVLEAVGSGMTSGQFDEHFIGSVRRECPVDFIRLDAPMLSTRSQQQANLQVLQGLMEEGLVSAEEMDDGQIMYRVVLEEE